MSRFKALGLTTPLGTMNAYDVDMLLAVDSVILKLRAELEEEEAKGAKPPPGKK